jgi:hypothetical protein
MEEQKQLKLKEKHQKKLEKSLKKIKKINADTDDIDDNIDKYKDGLNKLIENELILWNKGVKHNKKTEEGVIQYYTKVYNNKYIKQYGKLPEIDDIDMNDVYKVDDIDMNDIYNKKQDKYNNNPLSNKKMSAKEKEDYNNKKMTPEEKDEYEKLKADSKKHMNDIYDIYNKPDEPIIDPYESLNMFDLSTEGAQNNILSNSSSGSMPSLESNNSNLSDVNNIDSVDVNDPNYVPDNNMFV